MYYDTNRAYLKLWLWIIATKGVSAIKIVSSRGRNVNKGKSVNKRKTIKQNKSSGKSKAALIITLTLIIVIAVALVTFGFYVSSLDTVFPNVWADGINLSGMTLEEASRRLINEGYENNAEGVAASIVFTNGGGFTINGEEAGFSLNAEEAAVAAF